MLEKIQGWIDDFTHVQDKIFSFLDNMELEQAITTLESLQKLCWIVPSVVGGIELILLALPILNTLNFQYLILLFFLVCSLNLVASFVIGRYLFYFYSRQTKLDPKEKIATMWSVQKTSDLQTCITEAVISALPFTFTILPYLEFLRLHPTVAGWTVAMTDELSGNPYILRIFIMSIPFIFGLYLYQRVKAQEKIQKPNINEWMAGFQYHKRELHSVLSGVPKQKGKLVGPEPYIVLGTSIQTGDLVELPPVNRRQNAVYFGPVGAGKTSTIFKPQIKQDIDYYLRFIRDFPKISKEPGFMKDENNIATRYLNGFAVIETSNDLCRSVYEMCIKMGVPKDKIVWLDPTNPKTPALNLLRGPVDTVVETVSNIIAGVKADNNDFFKQAERSHLKNFIFLLKLSCVYENKIATFPDLMALYNDIYVVVDKMKVLDKYVEALNVKLDEAKKDYDDSPDDEDAQTRYQELFDKYEVAYGTSAWFHNHIKVATFGQGVLKQKSGPHEGELMWIDDQAENVQGLKNTLDDLSKNKYLRRVLFRDSGDFNLDSLLYNGGILLCNTAKAELQDALANRLGQIYLMSLQGATFRRKPNSVPNFALYADEFPDFVSEAFKSYIAQARKFFVPIVVCAQSPSQLSYSFGQDFFNTLMTNMLTRGTFGDLGAQDAQLLEPFFGEHSEVDESMNDQEIDLTADQDSNRRMISARRSMKPNITAAQIQALPKFTIAIRRPSKAGSEMFDLIKTHYLTDEDLLNDPNVFDINNPRDYEAYDEMMRNSKNINQDFDEVDKEIIADVEAGKFPSPSEKDLKKKAKDGKPSEGNNADDDLKRSHGGKGANKKRSAQSGVNGFEDELLNPNKDKDKTDPPEDEDDEFSNGAGESIEDLEKKGEDTGEVFNAVDDDDAGVIFSELNDDEDLTHVGDATPTTVKEVQKEKEKMRDLAHAAVHKADSQGHGGNNRLNTGVETTRHLDEVPSSDAASVILKVKEPVTKEPVKPEKTSPTPSTQTADKSDVDDIFAEFDQPDQSNKPNNSSTLPDSESEEKDKMLIKKGDKLLETKKDRHSMDEMRNMNDKAYIENLQKETAHDLEQGLAAIARDFTITDDEKLAKLQKFRDDNYENILSTWPDAETSHKVLSRINSVIKKQALKAGKQPEPINKNDDLESMMKKTKESGSKDALANELAKMLDQFGDEASTAGFDRGETGGGFMESGDPFMQQHGMDD